MSVKIALVGKSQSGKSFVATVLRTEHDFSKISLQDPTKAIARKLWTYKRGERVNWERRYKLYDALYKIDSDVWARFLLTRVSLSTKNIVVDDVRYINELQMLRESGFVIVRITAPENARKKRIPLAGTSLAPGSMLLHEYFNKDYTELVRADYTINNADRNSTRKSINELLKNLT